MELRLHTLIFVCMALGIVLGVLLWRVPEDAQQDGWYGAVLCLMANVIADNGPRVFESLGWYCGTVIGGIGVHVILLVAIVGTVGGMHPWRFLKGMREAWAIAFATFATRSSAATLPVTMRC